MWHPGGMTTSTYAIEAVGLVKRYGEKTALDGVSFEVPAGTEVSLTMRMREVAPPPSGMPRREYPPPSAVRMGLDKIWRELEAELKTSGVPVRSR